MSDVHRARYSLPKFGKHSYAVLMKTINNALVIESSDTAAFRLHVMEVYYHHGWKAAVHAFKVGKSTLYRWRKRYEQSRKKLVSLVPISTKPHHLRSMQTDLRIIAFIASFRQQYGNISKYKIKPFLTEYTKQIGIAAIGITTIGKLIKRKQLFQLKKKRYRRKHDRSVSRIKHAPRETLPGYIEMDSIQLYVLGRRWCFVSCIDVVTKVALVEVVSSLSSRSTTAVFTSFKRLYPVRVVQTDNGSEFLGEFHTYLDTDQITHQFIYPRSPRINGVVERFNRTVQEECINRNDEIFYDLEAFKRKLSEYLIWYNTKRPHHALKLKTPIEVYNQLTTFPKCR